MKHKKQVDEFYLFLDRVELDPELKEYLERKMKVIESGVQREIKEVEY